jgi:hypothetical protein
MTWIVSLSVECGIEKNQAEFLGAHFEHLSFDLVTGKSSACHRIVHQDAINNWWVTICPDNITRSGISSFDDAIEISELGFRLYKRLMSAPAFRYALFGCAVDGFRIYSELADDVASYPDGHKELDFNGLVLKEEVWEELGRPIGVLSFAEGYLWNPYGGTCYSPLSEGNEYSERLKRIRNEIPSLRAESDT